ncbi:MAG: hypothetical protein CSA52_04180 [Gammaproteobacteria bacterium]|nr:MAG: hypothetical protein CSB48_08765 [Pseudomonadota bacterium]PIE37919.1 MAG: hypothetical protein CSA52_04180 [Gammaproteobacteria bacterium]
MELSYISFGGLSQLCRDTLASSAVILVSSYTPYFRELAGRRGLAIVGMEWYQVVVDCKGADQVAKEEEQIEREKQAGKAQASPVLKSRRLCFCYRVLVW